MRHSMTRRATPLGTAVALLAAAGLVGAGAAQAEPGAAGAAVGAAAAQEILAANDPDHDTPADRQWNAASAVPVTLNGTSATSGGAGVTVNGSTVTITAAGTYSLSGSLNGQVVVQAPDQSLVQLVLAGATISSSTSAAINVVNAGTAVVILADGTTNRLTDATTYVYPDANTKEPDAALFSTEGLTIAGNGTLNVTSNSKDGIASKDGIVISSGTVTVNAADDGIRGKDYVVVDGGSTTVTARAEGVKSTNDADATRGYVAVNAGTLNVTSGADGLKAETDVVVGGGSVTVTSGGGSARAVSGDASAKALKAKVNVVVGEGQVRLDAADDGMHSGGVATVAGGTVSIASADDAVHADATVNVSGGTLNVTRSFEGLESLKINISGGSTTVVSTDDGVNATEEGINEFAASTNAVITVSGGTTVVDAGVDGVDSNGPLTVTGGTLVASCGASMGGGEGGIDTNGPINFRGGTVVASGMTSMAVMALPPTNGQGWVSGRFGAAQNAGTVVHLVQNNQVIASYKAPRRFQEVVFSSDRVTNGQSYQFYTGGSLSGTVIGGVLSTTGSISGANQSTTATAGQYSGGLVGMNFGGFTGGQQGFGTQPTFGVQVG